MHQPTAAVALSLALVLLPPALSGQTNLLVASPVASYTASSLNGGIFGMGSFAPGQGPGGNDAYHADCTFTPDFYGFFLLGGVANQVAIAENDIVAMSFRLRSRGAAPASALAQFYLQDASNDFSFVNKTDVDSGQNWEHKQIQFTVTKSGGYAVNDLKFNIALGFQKQQVAVADVRAYSFPAGTSQEVIDATMARAPLEDNFEASFVSDPPRGELPPDWSHDNSTGTSTVSYSRISGGAAHAGIGSFQIDLSTLTSGELTVARDAVPLDSAFHVEISFAARSPDGLTPEFRLQDSAGITTYQSVSGPTLDGNWTQYSLKIPPPDTDGTGRLALVLNSAGVVEIDDLQFDFQSAVNGVRTGNLLYTSSFPTGLHAPWGGIPGNPYYWEPGDYVPDPLEIGPTGVPSLRLTPAGRDERSLVFLLSHFLAEAGRDYTVSFYAKADFSAANTQIRIGPVGESLFTSPWVANFSLPEPNQSYDSSLALGWQRFEYTVTMPDNIPDNLARIEILFNRNSDPNCRIWVDGFQVEQASSAGPFERTDTLELSVYPPVFPDRDGVIFEGESLSFRYTALGPANGTIPVDAVLKSQVYEFDGNSIQSLPDTPLANTAWTDGLISIPETGLLPLGPYRIEAWVEDGIGNKLSRVAECMLYRVRQPKYWGVVAPQSRFGTHTNASNSIIATMKKLGFNWIRSFRLNWNELQDRDVEPAPENKNVYDFAVMDRLMDFHRDNDLTVLGILGGTPKWATRQPEGPSAGFRDSLFAVKPDYLDEWADYAAAIAQQYSDLIPIWESWNEPYFARFFIDTFDGSTINGATGQQLYDMTAAASDAIKAVLPNVDIWWNMGGTTDGMSVPDFDGTAIPAGILSKIDGVSMHYYDQTRYFDDNSDFAQEVQYIKNDLIAEGRQDLADTLLISEGCNLSPSQLFSSYQHIAPLRTSGQTQDVAEAHARMMAIRFHAGNQKVISYAFFQLVNFQGNYSYMNADSTMHPIGSAVSNAMWHMEDKNPSGYLDLNSKVAVFLFSDGTESVAYVTPLTGETENLTFNIPGTVCRNVWGNTISYPVSLGDGDHWITATNMSVEELSMRIEDALGLTAYGAWQQANFTPSERADASISGDNADPDGDREINLWEFGTITDPRDGNNKSDFAWSYSKSGGMHNIDATLTRRNDDPLLNFRVKAYSDIDQTPEIVAESSGTGTLTGPAVVIDTDNADGSASSELQDSQDAASVDRRFIELEFSR